MDTTRELAQAPVGSLLRRYYIPALVSVMANALYNIVDRIFIGQGLGSAALSGVSVVFPIMMVGIACAALLGVGSGVLVSLRLGGRDHTGAEQVLGCGLLLMLLLSGLLTGVGLAVKIPALRAFGVTPETVAYGDAYLTIILLGAVFQVVGFGLTNIVRAEGHANTAMYAMVMSAGLNVVLDPLFIFGLGLGVRGAAIATVLAQAVMCAWMLLHFCSSRCVVRLRLQCLRISLPVTRQIVGAGMATFALHAAMSAVHALMNVQLVAYGGDVAVAAMGIIGSCVALVIMSMVALNMAAQPIEGYNYGAGAYDRVRQVLHISAALATAISLVGVLLFQFFPDWLVALFNNRDPELMRIGVQGFRLHLAMLPLIGFQIISSGFFQAIGRTVIATWTTVLRQIVVLIPLLLVLPRFFDLTGVWVAGPIADFISGVVVAACVRREWRRMSRGG